MNSISEFQKLYLIEHNSRKPVQKIAIEFPRRSHRGLIIHVSSPSDAIPMGKMNFVDLAGSDKFLQHKYFSAFPLAGISIYF